VKLLAPLFALGLVLVAGPILIHLYGRDRAARRRFPAARLLLAAQRRLSPQARLEQWLLVLLRALAVAAVVIVLMRPIWERAAVLPSSVGLRQAAVIVLDDSLSMSRRDRGRTLFERGRAAAQELVRAFPEGSEVAVLSTTSVERDPMPRLERDRTLVGHALGRAGASARAGDSTAALARAAALLSASVAPHRRIYLVSDLAASDFDPDHPRPFAAGDGPDAVGLEVLRIGDAPPPNDAVLSVEVRAAGDRSTRRLRVAAGLRASGRAAHSRTVSLFIDGAPVARGLVALPADGVTDKHFEYAVPAGAEPRWVEVALDADPDDSLALDDRRAAPVHGGGGRIVLVDGAPGASRREDETFYLETALRAARGAGAALEVIHEEQLGAIDLNEVAVLFLCNPRPAPSLAVLAPYVERGGGLFISLGDNLEAAALSSQLQALLPSAIEGTRALSGPGGVAGGALRLTAPAPALLRWAPSLADERGREAWRAARTYHVALLRPIGDDDPSRDVLARFEDGSPALEERRVGDGRVALLATTVDRAWSDLSIQPVFPAFTLELVEHLGAVRAGVAEADLVMVGQPAARPLQRARGDGPDRRAELMLTTPAGEHRRLVIDATHTAAPVPEQPGRHLLELVDPAPKAARAPVSFASVLDPRESEPTLLPDAAQLATPAPAAAPGRPPAAELWHAVAGLLLALLVAEALLGLRG
jgi:hypothetical protein